MKRVFSVIAVLFLVYPALWAQFAIQEFALGKKADYLQTSSAVPVSSTILSDPNGPYHFSAYLGGSGLNLANPPTRVRTPANSQYDLTGTGSEVIYYADFTSKGAMDAAFSNGTYTFTGGSVSLPLSMGGADAYPMDVPMITNGYWNGDGRLILGAYANTTLNFSDFSQYSTGVGGIIGFELYSMNGNTIDAPVVSASSAALTGYPSDPKLTSVTIPSSTLQPNRLYYAEVTFTRIATLNIDYVTSLGSAGMAIFVNSTAFVISTGTPPEFERAFGNMTVSSGSTLFFNALLKSPNTPTNYQWQRLPVGTETWVNLTNDAVFSGVTTNELKVTAVPYSMNGDKFRVVATNIGGTASSYSATLTVMPPPLPYIWQHPMTQGANTGQTASFNVGVYYSSDPISYQWYHNGHPIAGATDAMLQIPNVKLTDAGTYTVKVTNSGGSVFSNFANLSVMMTMPAGFDMAGYYARNSDIAAAFGSDHTGAWLHYWNFGLLEGRQYDSQFVVDEYLLLNPDLQSFFSGDKQAALLHWLTYGKPIEDRIGRVPIGFNVDSYLARYPDLQAAFAGITPTALRNVTVWNHYVDYGVREGRSDGDFEAYNYLATNSDLSAVFGTDVEAAAWHWYFYGRREGRRIPSNFDVNGYRSRNPDVVTVWGNDKYGCWLHYRDTGVYEGRTYDDLFRVLEYRSRYSDVQTAYGNNLTGVLNHWLYYGKPEGRFGRNP